MALLPPALMDRLGARWELDGSGTYTRPTFFGSWGRGYTHAELSSLRGPLTVAVAGPPATGIAGAPAW